MMSKVNVIRAWKDELYRASLSKEERAQLPAHPAGIIELDADQLSTVTGGTTFPCAVGVTVILSCLPPCPATIDGTCGMFSIGCCEETPEPVEPSTQVPIEPR